MNKKTILITGGSSGIGSSIVTKFAKNNCNIIFTYLNHEEKALVLKEKIEKEYNVSCTCIRCDVTNEKDIDNLYNIVVDKFKNIDVLVNNAAIAIDNLFDNKTKEEFIKTLDTNLVSVFLISRLFGNLMYKNKSGKIINISSNNGIDSYYEFSLDYDASKAGLINLTHNLAHHFSPYINVNCVCPGWVNTPMNETLSEEFKKKEIDKILLKRFANPDEIADLVYYLSSNEASYINDSIIKIDGGINRE